MTRVLAWLVKGRGCCSGKNEGGGGGGGLSVGFFFLMKSVEKTAWEKNKY